MQWDPRELFYLHDWNVIDVPDGHDWQQIVAAQRLALDARQRPAHGDRLPHVKGWRYGIEGKASHGAGHKLCSEGFYDALAELTAGGGDAEPALPVCEPGDHRCDGPAGPEVREECFWAALEIVREHVEASAAQTAALAGRLAASRARLEARGRRPRAGAPRVEAAYEAAVRDAAAIPDELRLAPGSSTTLRQELGAVPATA